MKIGDIPKDLIERMAAAMLDPALAVPGCPAPSGNLVRCRVLERALDAAAKEGWRLTLVRDHASRDTA